MVCPTMKTPLKRSSSNSKLSIQNRKKKTPKNRPPKLSRWQQQFVLDGFDDELKIACTGISAGKSRALAWWLVLQMISKPGCRCIAIAQTHKALKRVLIREIQIVCAILKKSYQYNKTDQELTLSNGSVVFGYSAEAPEGMLGLSEIDILCMDESAFIPRVCYDYASDRMRGGRYEPMVRLISSPQSMAVENWFSEICKQHPECVIHATAFDNPFTKKKFKQNLKERYVEGSNIYRQQVLGEIFDFDIASQIVMRSDFIADKLPCHDAQYWLGADFAGLGADSNAVVVIDKTGMVDWREAPDLNTNQKAEQIYDAYLNFHPVASCGDATGGYGQGAIDLLTNKNITVTGINFSQKATDEDLYPNVRTQMFLELAQAIRAGFWVTDEVKVQLLAHQVSIDKRGRQSLLPKELAKKQLGGKSPDMADAVALAVYAMNHGGATASQGYTSKQAQAIGDRYLALFAANN